MVRIPSVEVDLSVTQLYRLLFPISRMGSYMHLLIDWIAYIMDFVTPVAED